MFRSTSHYLRVKRQVHYSIYKPGYNLAIGSEANTVALNVDIIDLCNFLPTFCEISF